MEHIHCASLTQQIKNIDPEFSGEVYTTLSDFITTSAPFNVLSVEHIFEGTLVSAFDGDTSYSVFLTQTYDAATINDANVESLDAVWQRHNARSEDIQKLAPVLSAAYPGKFKGRLFDTLIQANSVMGSFYRVKKVWLEFDYTLVLLEDVRQHLRESQLIVVRGEHSADEVFNTLKSTPFSFSR